MSLGLYVVLIQGTSSGKVSIKIITGYKTLRLEQSYG